MIIGNFGIALFYMEVLLGDDKTSANYLFHHITPVVWRTQNILGVFTKS